MRERSTRVGPSRNAKFRQGARPPKCPTILDVRNPISGSAVTALNGVIVNLSQHRITAALILSLGSALISKAIQMPDAKAGAGKLITVDSVKPLIVALSDDSFDGRGAGYPGELRAARYIAKQYGALGLQPMGDMSHGKRTFFQQFSFMPHYPVHPWETLKSRNVISFLEGSDPVLKNEIIVIGAHYDGQGRAGQADAFRKPLSDLTAAPDSIWNSANDNLSSVSAVLSIARAIKQGGITMKRSVLFIAFGAEEHEAAGSVYYVNHPVRPLLAHNAMINLECVGRMPGKPFQVDAMMSGSFWAAALKEAASESGVQSESNIPIPIPDSDHYPFDSAKVAAITISSNYDPDRHRPSDTSDKVDFDRVVEASKFCCAMLTYLANKPEHFGYAPLPFPDMGIMADLASPAECDAIHLKPEEGCLRITGVIPGRSGEKLGLVQGDALLQVAGQGFRRDETLGELQKFYESVLRGKFGKSVKLIVLRKGKSLEFTMPIS